MQIMEEVNDIATQCTSNKLMELMPDPHTDNRLLPVGMQRRDNGGRLRHCRIAIGKAMQNCITEQQRKILKLHYFQGAKKIEIAKLLGLTPSAVTKSLRAGERALREYAAMYMEIYDRLQLEHLNEE